MKHSFTQHSASTCDQLGRYQVAPSQVQVSVSRSLRASGLKRHGFGTKPLQNAACETGKASMKVQRPHQRRNLTHHDS